MFRERIVWDDLQRWGVGRPGGQQMIGRGQGIATGHLHQIRLRLVDQ